MMKKANPRKIPAEYKAAARRDPGGDVLLPTGAKLYFLGLAFFVGGYAEDGRDVAPYL